DVSRALSPASEWSLSTIGQAGRMAMAAAADPDADLAAHLQDLADAGDIEGFLGQVRDAIDLAGGDRTFGEHLDPLLGRIRAALGGLDTRQLPRHERDGVESTLDALDAHLGPRGVHGPEVHG